MPVLRRGVNQTTKSLFDSGPLGGRGGRGQFIPYVTVTDDQHKVQLRVVTAVSEDDPHKDKAKDMIMEAVFHRIPQTSSRGKQFYISVLCELDQDPETEEWSGNCQYCEQEIGRSVNFMLWTYVYAYYYPTPMPGKETTPTTFQGKLMHKEVVEDYQLWMDGYFMYIVLQEKIAANKTLMDRDFLVTRIGKKRSGKVQRILNPGQVKEADDAVFAGVANLPSLEDVATRKVETMDGATVESSAPATEYTEVDLPVEDFSIDDTFDDSELPW